MTNEDSEVLKPQQETSGQARSDSTPNNTSQERISFLKRLRDKVVEKAAQTS